MKLYPNKKISYNQNQMKQTAKTNFTSSIASSFKHRHCVNDVNHMTLKVSVQKSSQIGENQYKKAMKHMMRLNLQMDKSKQKIEKSQSELTQEHTFKPRVNHPSQLNYLYESMSLSADKLKYIHQSKERNPNQKFYDRLINWGKNHDDRVRDNFLRGRVSKDSLQNFSLSTTLRNSQQKLTKFENTVESIQKMEKKIIGSLGQTRRNKKQMSKTFVQGEQSFYQRQAKAIAIKNGQGYYYATNIHSSA